MTAGTALSLTQSVTSFDAGAHVTALGWLKGAAAFGLGDGGVVLAKDGETHRVEAHPDAGVLVGASDGERFVTGGDDGRVAVTGQDGSTQTLAETKGAWIDSLALSPGGAFAYGAGKRVIARDDRGREKTLEVPSTARGLAFAPKGYRLAISHYNGATLWFPNVEAKPELLEWKGSHLDVIWSHDGKWLATSGAEAAIIWPFESKEGPMGKQPRECGVRPAKVSRVAFHPNTYVLAVGYEDGCILLIRLADASELLVRPAVKGSGVTALAWDRGGKRLAFGCEDGQAGLLTLPT
jgi:WD40 repeat protein